VENKFDDIFNHVATIYARDRRTDGRTEPDTLHFHIASRGKSQTRRSLDRAKLANN